jgi:uncharacterized protein YdbL (DUF1318 family)
MLKSICKNVLKVSTFVLLAASVCGPVAAMSAQEAKSKGLVEEDCQGYVKPMNAGGQAVASQINEQRKAAYAQLVTPQLPLEAVAAAAGKKLCKG